MPDESYASFLASMPESVRKVVEAEEIRAGREIPGLRNGLEHGTKNPASETRVKQYIMRVFLAFSRAICKLGLAGPFPFPQMGAQCRTFFHLLADHTYAQKIGRRRGLIAEGLHSESFRAVLRGLEKTPEWEKHEIGLRGVEDQYLAELDKAAEPPIFDWASNLFGTLVSPGSADDPHFEDGDSPDESETDSIGVGEAKSEDCAADDVGTDQENPATEESQSAAPGQSGASRSTGADDQTADALDSEFWDCRFASERGPGNALDSEFARDNPAEILKCVTSSRLVAMEALHESAKDVVLREEPTTAKLAMRFVQPAFSKYARNCSTLAPRQHSQSVVSQPAQKLTRVGCGQNAHGL